MPQQALQQADKRKDHHENGIGITLCAIGAILAFAVTTNTSVFNLHTAGWVLIIIGIVGIAIPRRGYGWVGPPRDHPADPPRGHGGQGGGDHLPGLREPEPGQHPRPGGPARPGRAGQPGGGQPHRCPAPAPATSTPEGRSPLDETEIIEDVYEKKKKKKKKFFFFSFPYGVTRAREANPTVMSQ